MTPELKDLTRHTLHLAIIGLIDTQINLMVNVRPVVVYEELEATHGLQFVELLNAIEKAEQAAADAQRMLLDLF